MYQFTKHPRLVAPAVFAVVVVTVEVEGLSVVTVVLAEVVVELAGADVVFEASVVVVVTASVVAVTLAEVVEFESTVVVTTVVVAAVVVELLRGVVGASGVGVPSV